LARKGHIKRTVYLWLSATIGSSAILIAKTVVGWPVCYGLPAKLLSKYGHLGLLIYFLILFVGSVIFVAIYDMIGLDLFKVVEIKELLRQAVNSKKVAFLVRLFRATARIFRPKEGHQTHPTLRWFGVYLFLSWQLLPPVALVYLRNGRPPGNKAKELLILLGSSTIAAIYWGVLAFPILAGWKALTHYLGY